MLHIWDNELASINNFLLKARKPNPFIWRFLLKASKNYSISCFSPIQNPIRMLKFSCSIIETLEWTLTKVPLQEESSKEYKLAPNTRCLSITDRKWTKIISGSQESLFNPFKTWFWASRWSIPLKAEKNAWSPALKWKKGTAWSTKIWFWEAKSLLRTFPATTIKGESSIWEFWLLAIITFWLEATKTLRTLQSLASR